jgi:hypothetical protein
VRAETVAEELQAEIAICPWCLTQRADLHAWLILDPGWYDIYPAALATRQGRPALVANTFAAPIPDLVPILHQSEELGSSLMPEFPRRFAATTTRLRELMATRLGPARWLELVQPVASTDSASIAQWIRDNTAEVISLVDWSNWLMGSAVTGVTFTPTGGRLELAFRTTAQASVVIRFDSAAEWSCRVDCERGEVVIHSPTRLTWRTADGGGDETLSHERSPHEMILDQFCRRALGGLVPVPTARNALAAIATCQQALEAATRCAAGP